MELLPLWLAPNTVTLLGFLFIIVNVGLVLVYVPDLVGPVGGFFLCSKDNAMVLMLIFLEAGSILGILQFCLWLMDVCNHFSKRAFNRVGSDEHAGILPWTTSTGSKHAAQVLLVDWVSYLSMRCPDQALLIIWTTRFP